MLPTAVRLRTASEFAAVLRGGRRSGTRTLVVHSLATGLDRPARAGFVVSRKVGNAVVRHRVTRRLRPLVRAALPGLPAGTDLVIRALPAAADASSVVLGRDLAGALHGRSRGRSSVGTPRTSAEVGR